MEEQVDHNAVLRVGLDLVVMKEKEDGGDIRVPHKYRARASVLAITGTATTANSKRLTTLALCLILKC